MGFDSVQVLTTDHHGYLAIYCLEKGRMIASKRLSQEPIISIIFRPESQDYLIATHGKIQCWRVCRDVGYNLLRGGHKGPIISMFTCSGGLVRAKMQAALVLKRTSNDHDSEVLKEYSSIPKSLLVDLFSY